MECAPGLLLLLWFIRLLPIGAAKEIVYAHSIKIRKRTQNMRRNHSLTALIIGIGALRHIDRRANLRLRKIGILA